MAPPRTTHRLLLWMGALFALPAALCAAAMLLNLGQYWGAADYPGAVLVADHNMVKALPHPILRRDTTYRTLDPFPAVYNWYSNGFSLGPEARAQSACIQMEAGTNRFGLLERHMSVMLCDTPKGRMIFVMRSLALRLRAP